MVAMPNLTFEMPHWLYWASLVLFPLAAMALHQRTKRSRQRPRASLGIGYLLWATGGFVGLHRFYAHSRWGLIYIPFFLAVLFGNAEVRQARDTLSSARRDLQSAEFDVDYWSRQLQSGTENAAGALGDAQNHIVGLQELLTQATEGLARWEGIVGMTALLIALLLLIDAVLLPGLIRRRREREHERVLADPTEEEAALHAGESMVFHDERPLKQRLEFSLTVDALNRFVGEFVGYWSVIAVFVYYYEVVARYVFNSPTNWAHESMFLMFGMQYLLAGGFALLNESYVRVDVFYANFSPRGKAICDLITSVFFFIFVAAILWSGYVFARDAVNYGEVSFTEWGIQYWPVKITIAVGALLLLLQGISKVLRDIAVVIAARA
jgi:TRAP-type mannitol/chloroaromatic compound transport system permease small subunit